MVYTRCKTWTKGSKAHALGENSRILLLTPKHRDNHDFEATNVGDLDPCMVEGDGHSHLTSCIAMSGSNSMPQPLNYVNDEKVALDLAGCCGVRSS